MTSQGVQFGPMEPIAGLRSQLMIWGGLIFLYIAWGSTYPAIRVAVETVPPFLTASLRYLIGGTVILLLARIRGERGMLFNKRELRSALIVGFSMAVVSNGGVAWAEQRAEAGFVALILATVPLWMALIDRCFVSAAYTRVETIGLAVGFAGIVMLVGPSVSEGTNLPEIALCLLAALGWATGSLYSREVVDMQRPLTSTASWMIIGGALLALISTVRGEMSPDILAGISQKSMIAVGYLIVFGTLLGFSIYMWLLRVGRTTVISTYAYVNPVVAVVIGAVFLHEAITWEMWSGGTLVLVSVALVIATHRSDIRRSAPISEV